MQASYTDEGIVLKTVEYGEADKLIWILSRHHGYIELVAKGARRPISKKSSHIDLLNHIKFQTSRGHSPQLLSQLESLDTYTNIKSDIKLSQTSFFIMEILNCLMAAEQSDEKMFLSLKNYLDTLNSNAPKNLGITTTNFQMYILRHLGYPIPENITTDQLPRYFEVIMDKKIVSRPPVLV